MGSLLACPSSLRKMRFQLRSFAYLACALCGSCTAATHPGSLCSTNEQVIFNCTVKHKLLSVCSKQDDRSSEYVQYRFGLPEKTELEYPSSKVSSKKKFRLSVTSYAGGGEAHLRFDNAGYSYIVFDRSVREEGGDAEFDSGVVIIKVGTEQRSILRCDDSSATLRAPAYSLFDRENFIPIFSGSGN